MSVSSFAGWGWDAVALVQERNLRLSDDFQVLSSVAAECQAKSRIPA